MSPDTTLGLDENFYSEECRKCVGQWLPHPAMNTWWHACRPRHLAHAAKRAQIWPVFDGPAG